MAKNPGSDQKTAGHETKTTQRKGNRRILLFPTEPSTIGRDKIDAAIKKVLSQKK